MGHQVKELLETAEKPIALSSEFRLEALKLLQTAKCSMLHVEQGRAMSVANSIKTFGNRPVTVFVMG